MKEDIEQVINEELEKIQQQQTQGEKTPDDKKEQ